MFAILIRHDRAKAVEILVKDLKVFSTFNEELYKEITQLLTLENFRYIPSPIFQCSCYVCLLVFDGIGKERDKMRFHLLTEVIEYSLEKFGGD